LDSFRESAEKSSLTADIISMACTWTELEYAALLLISSPFPALVDQYIAGARNYENSTNAHTRPALIGRVQLGRPDLSSEAEQN
jgi:hypothetical protein